MKADDGPPDGVVRVQPMGCKEERRDGRNDLGPAVFAQEASVVHRQTVRVHCKSACEVPSV